MSWRATLILVLLITATACADSDLSIPPFLVQGVIYKNGAGKSKFFVGGSLPLASATSSWRATTRHLALSSAPPSAGPQSPARNAPAFVSLRRAHDCIGSAIELAGGSAALASRVIARPFRAVAISDLLLSFPRRRESPFHFKLYIFPHNIAPYRMVRSDRNF